MSDMLQSRPFIALITLVTICVGPGFSESRAADDEGTAVLQGVIYLSDKSTRAAGASATAIGVSTGKTFRSNVTGTNGAYRITGLPPGTYDMALEILGSIFVSKTLFDLEAGSTTTISWAAVPNLASRKTSHAGELHGVATVVGTVGENASGKKKKERKNWATAGWIALVAALTAALLGNGGNDEQPISPSQP